MQGSSQLDLAAGRQDLRVEAGLWLRTQREKQGISQRELAEMVNVNYYTFISQIENGKGKIPPERYEVWARALGIDSRVFAIRMLGFYEPSTHELIFGS